MITIAVPVVINTEQRDITNKLICTFSGHMSGYTVRSRSFMYMNSVSPVTFPVIKSVQKFSLFFVINGYLGESVTSVIGAYCTHHVALCVRKKKRKKYCSLLSKCDTKAL